MEKTIQILIYIHAAFGAISLFVGFIALMAKKGRKTHRKAGLMFYYSMLLSGILAMVVSLLPNHESTFLFMIGIFSLYFVLTGRRALKFKAKYPNLTVDKWISWIMILTGLMMIALPIILSSHINIVLVVFAFVGIIFSVRDLLIFQKPKKLKKVWLKMHLGKMIGGYISATTAFVVVNAFLPGLYGWLAPGVIGGLVITYWLRKVGKKKKRRPLLVQ